MTAMDTIVAGAALVAVGFLAGGACASTMYETPYDELGRHELLLIWIFDRLRPRRR